MVTVKNKVVFLKRSLSSIDKNFQESSNIQGKLKKKITRLRKLKFDQDVTVTLTGSYKKFDYTIEPAEGKHVPEIKALLKIKGM